MSGPAAMAWIGLGSNLDGPADHIRRALEELDDLRDTRRVHASALYRSAPIGPADQPDYCNAAAAVQTRLSPRALLCDLQALEQAHGRRRNRRWGARTLDLDLLLYEGRILREPELTLPHPHLHERAFVLVPLAEIAPEVTVPGRGRVAALAAAVADQDVAPWEAA